MKAVNPFLYSDSNKRYYTYDYFLRRKFGKKCFKVPLEGSFTCPNIDGTKSTGGCTYCSLPKSPSPLRGKPIAEQFATQCEILHQKWEDAYYIPYFQDFTNTYAPLEKLKRLYEEALMLPGTVGLSIATRADALPDEIIDYLRDLNERTFLTIELGLQSIHEESAKRINRGHTYEEFLVTYEKLRGFNVCIHLINGLPGEDKAMMLESAKEMARLHPMMLKLHMLYVTEGTPIAEYYKRGKFKSLSLTEYVDVVCSQLEVLPKDIVIGRITGDGKAEHLIAPEWSKKKFVVMNEIDKELLRRDSYQGILYN